MQQELKEHDDDGAPLTDFPYLPPGSRAKRVKGEKKPLSCKFCGKRFSKKGFLARHERLHVKGEDGEEESDKFIVKRPYKPETRSYNCHLCGIVISRASKYYHMKYVHKIGFEIFKCFCGKEYSSKLGLKKHHLSHTGECLTKCHFY